MNTPSSKSVPSAAPGSEPLSPAPAASVDHPPDAAVDSAPPRLLDRMRQAIRLRHYSIRTEATYVDWARRFILFHDKRHPAELGASEVAAFLTHLAVGRPVAPSTQNQAKSALLFLYRVVLELQLPWLDEIVAAKGSRRLPVVRPSTSTCKFRNVTTSHPPIWRESH